MENFSTSATAATATAPTALCAAPGNRVSSAFLRISQRAPGFICRLQIPRSSKWFALRRSDKFGIPGTDMPGHEYLPDRDIASMSLWLSQFIVQSKLKQ